MQIIQKFPDIQIDYSKCTTPFNCKKCLQVCPQAVFHVIAAKIEKFKETDKTVTIIENPLAKTKPRVIAKDAIELRKKLKKSIMPEGLANRLTREEILDLIAYIVARGKKDNPIFMKHMKH